MDDAPSSASTPATPRLREVLVKLGLSLLVALLFLWLLRAGALPVWPGEAQLAAVGKGHLLVAALLWTVMHAVRALRWQLLVSAVAELPKVRVFGVALLGFTAGLILPLRTGEAVRPVLLGREGASPWAAAGTVAAERVLDGAFISSILLVAINLAPPREPLPTHLGHLQVNVALVPHGASVAAVLFVSAFFVLLAFYRFRAISQSLCQKLLSPLSPKLADGVTRRLVELTSGLGFLSRAKVNVPFAALTVVYWGLNVTGLFVLAQGAGFESLSFVGTAAALGVMAVGITLPSAPGLFGSYQLSLYAGLLLYLSVDDVQGVGAAMVFAMYVAQVGIHLVGGVVGWVLLATTRKKAA
jgi:glycosyltransferase 2 family protein